MSSSSASRAAAPTAAPRLHYGRRLLSRCAAKGGKPARFGGFADLGRALGHTPPEKPPPPEPTVVWTAPERQEATTGGKTYEASRADRRKWRGGAGVVGVDHAAAKQLTRDISTCETAGVLLDLVELRLEDLDTIAVSTVLQRLARLPKPPGLEADARFVRLLVTAQVKLDAMEARALATAWSACGKLRLSLSPEWLATFWSAAEQRMSDFAPRDYSALLNACVGLNERPPPQLMPVFWQASLAKLEDANSQALSNTVFACQKLKLVPPGDWQAAFWQASTPAAAYNDDAAWSLAAGVLEIQQAAAGILQESRPVKHGAWACLPLHPSPA